MIRPLLTSNIVVWLNFSVFAVLLKVRKDDLYLR